MFKHFARHLAGATLLAGMATATPALAIIPPTNEF